MIRDVIFLNGPPGSGKDTVADYFEFHRIGINVKAAGPLKRALGELIGMYPEDIEELKDEPLQEVCRAYNLSDPSMTVRDALIQLSEGFAKPLLGRAVFGILLANEIDSRSASTFFVSDAGFLPEVNACKKTLREKTFGFSVDYEYRFHLWRMERPGADFDKDSRSYLPADDFDSFAILTNDAGVDKLLKSATTRYYKIKGASL